MSDLEHILTKLYQYGVERYKGQKKARVNESIEAILNLDLCNHCVGELKNERETG